MLDTWVIKTSRGTASSSSPEKKRKNSVDGDESVKKINCIGKETKKDTSKIFGEGSSPSEACMDLYPSIKKQMHASWYQRLVGEFSKPYFKQLQSFLAKEKQAGKIIFPPEDQIYTWAQFPFEEVKVVLLGQDPYHTPGKAHGLAFSVQPTERPPPSLQNMYLELKDDLQVSMEDQSGRGCLLPWSEQGVLLLNTVLTVEKGRPLAHAHQGWETFTTSVLQTLAHQHRTPIVWLAWGAHAQKLVRALPLPPTHQVFSASHPSPFSVHRGFFGSKPFSKTNAFLKKNGIAEIQWDRVFQ